MKIPTNAIFRVCLLLILFTLPLTSFSTPFVPLEQAEREANIRATAMPEGPQRVHLDDLDELGYVYHYEYFQLLTFLTEMQVSEAGADFGGMREGEQDLDIIQTDNTQEALRDWARYGFLTGDTTRFRQNIDDAWTYTLNWPAYLEEGGANPNYYRVHNCGWGLVAYMEYANTYGEDQTYLAYADSCARYIDNWRLSWQGVGVELNPLVAGYGAGTLYLYGVWRDNQEWIDAAQEIAEEVKAWIDANPNRLNANESWAMSGGTAMWGVVTALYSDDPVSGGIWIPTVSSYMDTYSGPGQWNNSWTVWYGHAWNAIHQVLGDGSSFDNVLEVADFLLDQDEIDDDGLIPATEGQYQNDQSWTSAYLAWYCLEYIMNIENDDYDVVAQEIISPTPGWDWWVNQPIPDARIQVSNGGMNPLEGGRAFSFAADIDGFEVYHSVDYDLDFGSNIIFDFETNYIPTNPGTEAFRLIVFTPNDEDPSNDTLVVEYNVVQTHQISGTVIAEGEDRYLNAEIIWTLNGSDPVRSYTSSTLVGTYLFSLAPGEYTFEIIPFDAPYPPIKETVIIEDSDIIDYNFFCPRLDILYVSEPGDSTWDHMMLRQFEELNNEAYYWSIPEKGRPYDTLSTVSTVFWATGDNGEILAEENQTLHIQNFLEDGGSFFLSGTNVMDAMGGSTFYQNYFGVNEASHDVAGALYHGLADFPITMGQSIVVNEGFAQNPPDGMIPVNGGLPLFTNAFTGDTMGVAFVHPEHEFKTVLLGFGAELIMEEVSTPYMSLQTFLGRTLEWFGHTLDVDNPEPQEFLPESWSMTTWPNPFNPTVNIRISVPEGQNASLKLFDILGRQVAYWDRIGKQGNTLIQWDGSDHSSGVYFLHMNTGKGTYSQKIILLR